MGEIMLKNGSLLSLVISFAIATPSTLASDREQLQGQWTVVSYYRNGDSIEDPPFDTVTFAADKVILTVKSRSAGEGSFRLEESTEPKQLDFLRGDNEHLGIYAIEGDTILWCQASPGSQRPTEFAAESGDGRTFITLKAAVRESTTPEVEENADTDSKDGSQNIGQALLFLFLSLLGFWFWRRIYNFANSRLINVVKYLRKGDFGLSRLDLNRLSPREAVRSYTRQIKSSSQRMFVQSSILPAIAMIAGLSIIRYLNLNFGIGTLSFVIFLVLVGLMRSIGYYFYGAYLSMRLSDEKTTSAEKLVCLLETPRSRFIYRIELLVLIVLGTALCFIRSDQWITPLTGG